MTACPECGDALWTPLGCEACGVLAHFADAPGAFEVFGLEPAWDVDRKALRRALLRLQRLTHPDHAGATDQAERATAALNHAHEVLADEFLRADDLIRRLGGPEEGAERQMPQEFLMEVLEWNEALDDAASSPAGSSEREGLGPLAEELKSQRAAVLAEVGAALTPLPASGTADLAGLRRRLNAVRYLARALERIRELRLAEANDTAPPRPSL